MEMETVDADLPWLCRVIARRYRSLLADPAVSPEDLLQEAWVGVVQAVNSRSFDPARGAETTFVYSCVSNYLCNLWRARFSQRRPPQPWSLEDVTHPQATEESGATMSLVSRREVNPADHAQYVEECGRIREEIDQVVSIVKDTVQSERSQRAFLIHYGLCCPEGTLVTFSQVALRLNLSNRQHAERLVNRVWELTIALLGLPNRHYADVWLQKEVERLRAIEEYLAVEIA